MIARAATISITSIVLLAAWIGAAALVAAVVAPAAFAVLPSRTLAGALVGRVLPVLFWTGIAIGAIATVLGVMASAGRFAAAASLAFAGACAVAQLVIAPRIEQVRAAIGGPVDALDPADPRRQAFGRLHGYSVLWMGVAMIAALVAMVLWARFLSSRAAA
jgi:hypothetical protein